MDERGLGTKVSVMQQEVHGNVDPCCELVTRHMTHSPPLPLRNSQLTLYCCCSCCPASAPRCHLTPKRCHSEGWSGLQGTSPCRFNHLQASLPQDTLSRIREVVRSLSTAAVLSKKKKGSFVSVGSSDVLLCALFLTGTLFWVLACWYWLILSDARWRLWICDFFLLSWHHLILCSSSLMLLHLLILKDFIIMNGSRTPGQLNFILRLRAKGSCLLAMGQPLVPGSKWWCSVTILLWLK